MPRPGLPFNGRHPCDPCNVFIENAVVITVDLDETGSFPVDEIVSKLAGKQIEWQVGDFWVLYCREGMGEFPSVFFSVVSMKLLVDFRVTEMNEFEYILLSITL